MSSDARTQSAHRAAAVPDAPVQALLARTDELARRWAIALILALPLERVGEIPLESFAREAPGFLNQVLRALRSDEELERLADPAAGSGEEARAGRLGGLTGARGGQAAVEAIEALRGVLWKALLDELRWPSFESSPARHVADLADRLAHVCSVALGSTLAEGPLAELPTRMPAPAVAEPSAASGGHDSSVTFAREPLATDVAIVDEAEPLIRRLPQTSAPNRSGRSAEARGRREQPAGGATRLHGQGRARPWDIPLDGGPDGER